MAVSFENIPAAGLIRTPLFFLEVDGSAAGSAAPNTNPVLLVGGLLAAGTAVAGDLLQVTSASEAKTLFGDGSILHEMVEAFRDNDAFGELWAIPLDDGAGVPRVVTITFAGAAAGADGILSLYIGGKRIQASVLLGDVIADMAAALDAAITASTEVLGFTSGVVGPVVTLTARHAGVALQDVDLRFNHLGSAAGEAFPAGITAPVIATTTPGTGAPILTGVDAIIGDELFDYIVYPYNETASIGEFDTIMAEVNGRWAWNRRLWGHAFTALRGTAGALGTLGNAENGKHNTGIGVEVNAPSNPWAYLCAALGRASQSLNNDPAQPMQTLELFGVLTPAKQNRFTQVQRNTLLFDGIATLVATDQGYKIERLITFFQLDPFGNADDAFLDCVTLFTLMRFNRRMERRITTDYPRHKLANDGTPIQTGQLILTPGQAEGTIIDEYLLMQADGLVESAELFAAALVIVRPAGDPNRLDAQVEPDLINQFRVMAMKNRFRLQYPATAV